MSFKGIFFDLYGTLIEYGDLKSAWENWLEAMYSSFAESDDSLSRSKFSLECRGMFRDTSFYDQPVFNGLTFFEQRIDRLAVTLGVELPDIRAVADKCVSAWQQDMKFDPQADEVLREMSRNRQVVLVSNFDHPRHIHGMLEENGWSSLFDHVVISGELGIQKPDVRIFEHALGLVSLSPTEVVHVGDSLEDDVLGAHGAGIVPVLLSRDDEDVNLPPGAHRIQTLVELSDRLVR